MDLHLFAGLPVSDLARALDWYERFLGKPPSMLPNDQEAVWDLGDRSSVYVVVDRDAAGGGHVTLFVEGEDYDRLLDGVRDRGIEPRLEEHYDNGVRKATYADPDGNEFGIGGGRMASDD